MPFYLFIYIIILYIILIKKPPCSPSMEHDVKDDVMTSFRRESGLLVKMEVEVSKVSSMFNGETVKLRYRSVSADSTDGGTTALRPMFYRS